MSKIEDFVKRNEMSESSKREMLEILNESLLEISEGIMREGIMREVKVERKVLGNVKEKRYKSKKAEEYAEEHGIRMEEFEMLEISKKDVENKVREMTKNKKEIRSEVKKEEVKKEIKREKVICAGINKKGEACKSVGTIRPEGAKKKYCFRHAEDYRSFECDSDSSENEEEKIEEEKIEEKENSEEEKIEEKENSDDELFEEEYN